MINLKPGLTALAVSLCVQQMAMAADIDQANSQGFIADSTLQVLLRNYYWNRDGKNGAGDRRDWSQGFLATYNSGFTQGTVGFGIDAFGYLGVKLDGGSGTTGLGNLPVDRHGNPEDEYGKSGAALKMRLSKTTLKWGEMQPKNPLFAPGGSRLLPQTAVGFNLLSNEIDNLSLDAGHFTSGTSPATTRSDGDLYASYARVAANSVDYLGGRYKLNDNLSFALYGSELEDIWRQYYANFSYSLPLGQGQALSLDFNGYRTDDHGRSLAGDIDNTTWSLAAGYSFLGAHKVTLAYQKVDSDTPFDTVAFGNGAGNKGDSVVLSNAIQYSDFNGPGEKSWQARYDLNMSSYGVPGLNLMARYVSGSGIDGTRLAADSAYFNRYGEDGKHHELNLEARYVVQSGSAKDLSVRVRQSWHRGNSDQREGDHNDLRVIIEYPLSIL
ncbi:OprD family porin [Ectopseudomonas chengduensis]|nr:OprD family porin [Pseudomonas sp. WS 5019]